MKCKNIGSIGNQYGALWVTECAGRYYWCIENYDTDFENLDDWDEIPKELHDTLNTYERKRLAEGEIMTDKNLEQIVQAIPEAKRILDLSWRNSEKDGIGRKYGELSVKELESFTKAIIRGCQ